MAISEIDKKFNNDMASKRDSSQKGSIGNRRHGAYPDGLPAFPARQKADLAYAEAADLAEGLQVLDHGAIIYCREGESMVRVNFDAWELKKDMAITIFPGDMVNWMFRSDDLKLDILRYDAEILREASLNIEHTVYTMLRRNRLCRNTQIAGHVAGEMLDLLHYYLDEQKCQSSERIVILQLTVFFLGFYDFLVTQPQAEDGDVSQRVNELFSRFMELLERDYRSHHDVRHYADELCITPKYLSIIAAKRTGQSPKKIIDEYIVLRMKVALRSARLSISQIASDFGFTDPSFFARYFKSHTRMTPQRYRNSMK